jgi:glycine oxidase
MSSTPQPPIVILGAGIIGASLALELRRRGADVLLIDHGQALAQASSAAAGMLAAGDPYNPPALRPLATLSASLYPDLLQRLAALTGLEVPFQTHTTLQYSAAGQSQLLEERSIDPRQLAAALRAALPLAGVTLHEHATSNAAPRNARTLIHTTGAWFQSSLAPPVTPRKGQMLRVRLPPSLRGLDQVHRSERIYIVPRLFGPQAGSALIGATVEDAGFDTTLQPTALSALREAASALLPALAGLDNAPALEAWAGLRPATPDQLPVLGKLPNDPAQIVATGHYRNGILLAPATAVLIADLLEGIPGPPWLQTFAPHRFALVAR